MPASSAGTPGTMRAERQLVTPRWRAAAMSTTEPSDETARAEAVLAEAGELIQAATDRSLTVRLVGSIAVRTHSPAHAHLLAPLGPPPHPPIHLMPSPHQHPHLPTLLPHP